MLICLFPATLVQSAEIDIMLVYDSTATTWVTNNGGMTAFSLDAVNRMNLANQNSNIDLNFRLVHAVTASYTHQDFYSDLNVLKNGSGGFADIHDLRDEYGADLVALLIDTGSAYGTTGLGYILGSYDGSARYGFTVSAIRSVEISHTLTHEVGHNLGAHHSKSQNSSPGPNDDLASYSAGWYFTGITDSKKYHTIMAYNRDGKGNSYYSAPMFSTPLLTYKGTVAGDSNDGDNSRLIRDTMAVVADYREPTLGNLAVAIEPYDARTEGAQWRRKGTTTWLNDGYIEKSLPAGEHVVEFKRIENWDTPPDLVVDVHVGQTTEADGYYTLTYDPVGSLAVTIEPEEARAAGAQWRRRGTDTWYDSGYTEESVGEGEHTVEFKWVHGWKKPGDTMVTVDIAQLSELDRTYTPFESTPPTGWLPLLLLNDE